MIRKTISILLIVALCLFLIPGGLSMANGPAIYTDSPTYDKGEQITITGEGFPVGAAITLTFLKDGVPVAIVPQLVYGPSFSCNYTTGTGWEYGEYQIRATYTGGDPVFTSFTLAPKGVLWTDKDNYFRGSTVLVYGEGFPVGPAITLSVIKDSVTIYILPTLFFGPDFDTSFVVGEDWAFGTYYVRATYIGSETKTVLSNPFEVVPVPPVPTGLNAVPGRNQVALTWDPVDNPYQSYYKIWRATSESGPYTLTATTALTSYLDSTALAFDGSYFYKLQSVDTYGNESAETDPVSATPWGDPDALVFDEISSPQVAGVPFEVTVTVKDAFGHTVLDHETPLLLSDSTGTISPAIFPITHGSGTNEVTITKAQTGVVIHAVGSPVEGDSNPFDVVHNPNVNHLVLEPEEATVRSGEEVAYTLTAFDDWDNEWDVTSDPETEYSIEEGAGGSWAGNVYTACKVGVWEVTASYGGKSDTASLEVIPGDAVEILLDPQEATNQVGETHQLTATLLDACGNPIPDALLTFTVSGAHEEDPVDLITDEEGKAVFEYTETTPGVDSIMVSYLPDPLGVPLVAYAEKTWIPGPVAEIVLSQESDTNVVGTPHEVVATAYDYFGNPVPDAEINFVISGDHEFDGTDITDENGKATFTYTVTFPVGVDEIWATYLPEPAGIPIYSNTLTKTWVPGPPAEIVWSEISSPQVAGDPFEVTLTVFDEYGNLCTNFDGTADLYVQGIGGNVSPSQTGNFFDGSWTGQITVEVPRNGAVLAAEIDGVVGLSNAFDVYLRITLNLTSGWNLVSLPIITDPNPLTVFSGLPAGWRLFTWDAAHAMYLDKNHSTLAVGKGFWLWLPSATNYTLVGPANLTATEISLSQGWNLIGTPFYFPVAWDNVQVRKGGETKSLPDAVAAGWVRSSAFFWQGGAYHLLTSGGSFQPKVGYWFYAKVSGCTLIFPD